MLSKQIARTIGFGIILVLTACDTVSRGADSVGQGFSRLWPWSSTESRAEAVAEGESSACPPVSVADDMGSMHQFTDPLQPADAQRISSVYIKSIGSNCVVNGNNLAVDLDIRLSGQLGPKARMQPGDKPSFSYPYFVAVTTMDGTVVAQEVYAASLSYGADDREMHQAESLRQIIPLEGFDDAGDYRVIAGFQLTDEELAYNRTRPAIAFANSDFAQ